MEVKKSPKADLETKRGLFLEIGMALTLAIVLLAFEWKVDTSETTGLAEVQEVEAEEEMIPVTRQEPVKPPPPPPPAPKVSDVLNIVDNEEEIEDELEIEDSEADQDEEVEIQEVVEEEEEEDEAQVFVIVEDMPEFPGGTHTLQGWINKRVKYPVIAQENGITGRVFISFVINKTGNVEQVRILRGVDPSLDKEAIRVIKSMPKWKPGKQRGKPVKVSYTVPINFQLQ
ncbi:MAG: energy transducer TonB [Marinifilaceae bacterium]